MLEERQYRGPPHGVLLAVVVFIVVLAPSLVGDQEAITEAISELLSPLGLLLLPIILLLTIHLLSSDHAGSILSAIFSTGQPDSIHRLSGSPVGVALFLVFILFLLYNRFSIFGGGGDSGD
ncbi:hypothetical protein K2173_022393 [Erythroxylum novogranatense]|uniref:Transmembrane protein n=1 Tax=Erythroxylum novogranatense TaxID=1862640 RepID=A0AAV8TK61_9ROSI|nr:hypothetical protein K2173_022393 [Erythroxylum novogranatense]